MSSGDQLFETRRQEAVALFQANQAARAVADRTLTLTFALAATTVAIASQAGPELALLPVPAVLWLLLSYMFSQHADLTILGATRRYLEEVLKKDVGDYGLIYEVAVADIHRRPAFMDQRVLGVVLAITIATLTVLEAITAFGGDALIGAVYLGGTTLAFSSAAFSWQARCRAWPEAIAGLQERLGHTLEPDEWDALTAHRPTMPLGDTARAFRAPTLKNDARRAVP